MVSSGCPVEQSFEGSSYYLYMFIGANFDPFQLSLGVKLHQGQTISDILELMVTSEGSGSEKLHPRNTSLSGRWFPRNVKWSVSDDRYLMQYVFLPWCTGRKEVTAKWFFGLYRKRVVLISTLWFYVMVLRHVIMSSNLPNRGWRRALSCFKGRIYLLVMDFLWLFIDDELLKLFAS